MSRTLPDFGPVCDAKRAKRALALRRRYGRAAAKKSREALLRDAMRDWMSGRAFISNRGRYMLRPLGMVAGMLTIVHGRATMAPWNKVAHEEWGDSTEGLHRAAHAAYPDPVVKSRLFEEG